MCLAIPGKVVAIEGESELRMARVDFGGVTREACLAYVPEAQIGDYVLVHVGFAIATVDEQAAQEALALFAEASALEDLGEEGANLRKEDPDLRKEDPDL